MKILDQVYESISINKTLLDNDSFIKSIGEVIDLWVEAIREGNKLLFCGNGGSAADAQHLAAELSNKFYKDRKPIYAEALHCNTSYLTAVSNDYNFNIVYSRLVEAIANEGDILVVLTTSGKSKNILLALEAAKTKNVKTIAFTGYNDYLDEICDIVLKIPSENVARIQESYMLWGHIICENVEQILFNVE